MSSLLSANFSAQQPKASAESLAFSSLLLLIVRLISRVYGGKSVSLLSDHSEA